jgi:hypothetical protein
MVVKHVFSFDVPAENMSNYIKWSGETAKPFFEKYPEVRSYDVYQTVAGKPTFVKEVVYEDMKAFCSMQGKLNGPEIQKVIGEFFSYIVNLETKLILEIV